MSSAQQFQNYFYDNDNEATFHVHMMTICSKIMRDQGHIAGQNFFRYDFKGALERARVCNHPEARWLTDLFAGRIVETLENVRKFF
jgi:hypothetical protein